MESLNHLGILLKLLNSKTITELTIWNKSRMLALIKVLTLIELSLIKSILLAVDQRSEIWIICFINEGRYAIVHCLTKLNHFVLDWHTLCLLLGALKKETLSSGGIL